MTEIDWGAALDALEARLDRQEEVIVGHRLDPPEGDLDLPEGELPPELLDRAQALLARSRHLEKLAERRLSQRRRVERTDVYGGAPVNYGSI